MDASPGVDAGTDAGDSAAIRPDANADAAPGEDSAAATLPDGAVFPQGTQVLASNVISLNGVTSDRYAIYTDTTANELYAVALAGGTPVSLGHLGPNASVAVAGPVAFYWNIVGKYSGVGPLSIWTSAHGVQSLATRSYPAPVVSVSGTRVIFLDNVVFTGSYPGDVYVANTDGSGKTKIVAGAQLDAEFNFAFAGETALVSAVTGADAGAGVTLQAFSAPAWAPVTLGTGLPGTFVTNNAGTAVLAQTAAGLDVFSLDGTAPVLIDPAGVAGLFTSDGTAVVYTSSSNALLRSSVAAGPPTPLVPTGFPSLAGLSPDNAWALGTVATAGFAGPGQGSDLYVASATAAGTAQTLSMTANVGPYSTANPLFTADASHLVFASDTTLTGLSTLHVSLPGGADASTYTDVWSFEPTVGSKLVFNDDYDPAGGVGSNGTADIEWLDTSKTAPKTVLVSQADANFFVTADHATLVYSWSYLPTKSGGIWTLPIP